MNLKILIKKPWRTVLARFGMEIGIAATGFVLVGLIWSIALVQIRIEREETIGTAINRNNNLTIAFEENTLQTLKSADTLARHIKLEYTRRRAQIDIKKLTSDLVLEARMFDAIAIVDHLGNVVA